MCVCILCDCEYAWYKMLGLMVLSSYWKDVVHMFSSVNLLGGLVCVNILTDFEYEEVMEFSCSNSRFSSSITAK